MAGEFKAWIEAQTDLTAEEKASILSAFSTEKLLGVADKGVMTQSRFNRSMDELRAKQQELAAERTRLEANWNKANQEYLEMQDNVATTQAQLDAKEKEVAALRQKADAVAVDPTKVITPEQLLDLRKQDAEAQTAFFADILEIQDEHQTLFGAKLSPREIIAKVTESNKLPRQWWEETYKVPEKRAEIAKAAHDKEIADAVEKGKQEAITAMSNPGTRTLRPSAQPFYTPEGKTGDGAEKHGPWDEEGEFPAETTLRQELEKAAFGA